MQPLTPSNKRSILSDVEYVMLEGHDLQDILLRIGMPQSTLEFQKLLVKVNPFVDCSSPQFLAEVWGIGEVLQDELLKCLYVAP